MGRGLMGMYCIVQIQTQLNSDATVPHESASCGIKWPVFSPTLTKSSDFSYLDLKAPCCQQAFQEIHLQKYVFDDDILPFSHNPLSIRRLRSAIVRLLVHVCSFHVCISYGTSHELCLYFTYLSSGRHLYVVSFADRTRFGYSPDKLTISYYQPSESTRPDAATNRNNCEKHGCKFLKATVPGCRCRSFLPIGSNAYLTVISYSYFSLPH